MENNPTNVALQARGNDRVPPVSSIFPLYHPQLTAYKTLFLDPNP